MEAFMKGLTDPSEKPDGPIDPEAAKQAEVLRKAWEQLLVDDLEATDDANMESASGSASSSKPTVPKPAESPKEPKSKVQDEFQKAVKQAMEKLKASDDTSKVRRHYVAGRTLIFPGGSIRR